jgi:hypothetical protein
VKVSKCLRAARNLQNHEEFFSFQFGVFEMLFWVSLLTVLIPQGFGDSHTLYVSNEIQMPTIGFGTAALGFLTKEMTCAAINAGVRLIDSAQAIEWYRESFVGEALKECYQAEFQTPLVVVTKIHPRSYM